MKKKLNYTSGLQSHELASGHRYLPMCADSKRARLSTDPAAILTEILGEPSGSAGTTANVDGGRRWGYRDKHLHQSQDDDLHTFPLSIHIILLHNKVKGNII